MTSIIVAHALHCGSILWQRPGKQQISSLLGLPKLPINSVRKFSGRFGNLAFYIQFFLHFLRYTLPCVSNTPSQTLRCSVNHFITHQIAGTPALTDYWGAWYQIIPHRWPLTSKQETGSVREPKGNFKPIHGFIKHSAFFVLSYTFRCCPSVLEVKHEIRLQVPFTFFLIKYFPPHYWTTLSSIFLTFSTGEINKDAKASLLLQRRPQKSAKILTSMSA